MNIARSTMVANPAITAALQRTKPVAVDQTQLEIPKVKSPPPADLADRWKAAETVRSQAKSAAEFHEQVAASQQLGTNDFYKNFMTYLKSVSPAEAVVDVKA